MKLIRFFAGYVRRRPGWLVVAALAVPLYAIASAGMVSLIEPIFSEVLQSDDGAPTMFGGGSDAEASEAPGAPGTTKSLFNVKATLERAYDGVRRLLGIDDREVVYFVPLLFIVVFVSRSGSNFISGYAFQRVGLGVTTDIRNDLYRKILGQSSSFHTAHRSGDLVSRVVNDVAMMQTAVSSQLLHLVQHTLTLILLLALLLSTHLRLALVCLVATPVLIYPVVRFGQSMRKISHRTQERMADVTALMNEGVRGHRVIKAFGAEDFENARFMEATGQHLRANLRAQLLSNLSSPVIESIGAAGSAVFLVYAGLQVRQGELTAPVLVQFLANLLLLYDPIRKLNKVNLVLQHALAASHRVAGMLDIPNEIVDRPGARAIEGIEREIAFDHVRFAYEPDRPIIDDVTLSIARGETVAFVGASGAGKTTLVNLLPRFFDPDDGAVRIDGVDVRDLKLCDLRRQIGIVTQETTLFDDTVRNNIAYGVADATDEKVRRAAEAAFADRFVEELPQGYETRIGESGSRLSGGQRQRLAIARALFKDAPILILDEATSQLDSESEALVQRALQNLMQGRTTLVVAHRLATVMRADRIIVMQDGRVVEQGSHAELLERGGVYKRLYDLQFEA